MKATKLESGSWMVNAYIGVDNEGKQMRKKFIGPDKKAVLADAAAFVLDHRNDKVVGTFATASEMFFKKCSKMSPSTVRGYKNIDGVLKRDFHMFYSRPCFSISTDDLQAVIDGLQNSGKSAKTIWNYYSFICSVLKSRQIRPPYVDLPERRKPDLNIPDEFTVCRTLLAAKSQSIELWICIALAATGPLREGEISALQFTYDTDVNFENGTIHVSHDYVLGDDEIYHLKDPKTQSSDRTITVLPNIMQAIKNQGYVTNWNPREIYNHFTRLCRDEGIPHYRFHDLRHYCASMLHAKGFPDAYIQQRTGHSSAEILRKVYTHTLDSEQKKIDSEMLEELARVVK